MDLTYKIVRRLLRDDDVKFSRNQNFEAFEDARVQRAVRIFRHLQSLEHDLLKLDGTDAKARLETVENIDEQITVQLSFSEHNGIRISYLTRREWLLLLENERVSAILLELIDNASDETQRVLRDSLAIA